MSMTNKPYETLGKHLKTVREHSKKSLAEVSGAVEIDELQLKLIESGQKRPEEEVMLLLISYFNMADQEALHIWGLAKYDTDLNEHIEFKPIEDEKDIAQQMMNKSILMLVSMDIRSIYSDGVEVSFNEAGLTMNFTQAGGPNNQPISVGKLGMSLEQAQKVKECLESALLHAKYNHKKLLPPKID